MCERAGLIKIPLVVHNPKLQCGVSVDDHSSLCSQLHVTLEDDEPNSLKHVHFRNMKMSQKLATIFDDANKDCSMIQALSLWNTGLPFTNSEITNTLTGWMKSHNLQHLSVGGSNIPTDVFNDLIGPKSQPLMLVKDCMSNL